jgi:hypothetical protein
MLKVATAALFLIVAFAEMADAQGDFAKPKTLPAAEEQRWVETVKSHKTDDGATVLEVLQFVAQMRPREFKFGEIEVGYNGATGEPDAVVIGYWIGLKRLPDDQIVNLGYDVHRRASGFDIKPIGWPISIALEHGRDAFLDAVGEEYEFLCVEPDARRKTC